MIRVVLALLLLAGAAVAQDSDAPVDDGTTVQSDGQGTMITSPIDGSSALIEDVPANDVRALAADGVRLKGLDKVSGEVTDLELTRGETKPVGRIEVTLGECRYPEDNIAGEGYAWLTIRDPSRDLVIFEGWMVASSPALNALDHPRYDIWVIRCTTA
jgi:hypothetical protein